MLSTFVRKFSNEFNEKSFSGKNDLVSYFGLEEELKKTSTAFIFSFSQSGEWFLKAWIESKDGNTSKESFMLALSKCQAGAGKYIFEELRNS